MPEPDEPSGPERFIRPYFSDPALWPVTIVLVIVFATFGATILLLAVRTRNLFSVAALLVLAVASVEAVRAERHRGRLGVVSGMILLLWGLSSAVALVASRLGIF